MWQLCLVLAGVCWCARAGPGPPDPFSFPHAIYNVSIPENSAGRTRALPEPGDPTPALPLPATGARVRFRIRHGDKDKFFKAEERTVGDLCFLTVRTRTGHADVLNRERRDHYRLDVRATALLPDGSQLEADTVVMVTVTDTNDLSPLFYPTEYEVTVPEDAPLHASVARVSAEDADLGLNGEIYYSLERPDQRFAVHPTSGVVTLTRALSATGGARHELAVLARDRASLLERGELAPAARATLVVRVARANLHAPELHVRRLPELVENSTSEIYAIVEVRDGDAGEHGRIAAVEIVDGDPDGHFRVRASRQRGEYDVVSHALLDRETAPGGYNLTLRATDAGRPPRASYLALPVTLTDANDNAPVFSRELYEAAVPETSPPGTPIVRLKVSDRDEGRNGRVFIEIVGGNEGGEFRVNPDTGVLYTAVTLDAETKALYALTVSAVDQGNAGTRHQSSAKVQVTVMDANDNDPVLVHAFVDALVPEGGAAGATVARVSARDADSGENAYISYSLANVQPVPFEVDHFSGVVRTTRVLDYESSRREWELRVRASDWGLPYRRQAEARVRVTLKDVNDNRPQFERVDCAGSVPRRLPPGAPLATLSALDFDSGDVVSYRIASGNEDGCFALDAASGVLSVACDLGGVRDDMRVINVTATDGTHFADPASLAIHLVRGAGEATIECRDTGVARRLAELLAAAERSNAPADSLDEFPPAPARYGENLHAPEFLDFPVEVKVNESVGLGTSLVRVRARDRDLGYNGLLVYAVSGGDPDSAFRIDPDTGELKVIGYLDREREAEYYLNVTVYDLGRPPRAASRLLPVTVVDVNDNAPRFRKTLASFRVTENALNGTDIFRAEATDRDAGVFGRVTYSLFDGDGDFCVDRTGGAVTVCAPLDRERRALYELRVRATDGGGLHAEAVVRVAVDDVNDNAPRFGLSSYSARVREDVPVGALVAVLEAFDADLGAGGEVHYTLGEGMGEGAFSVDSVSGSLRTLRPLDYETRQVYGVTVRATDGGRPALWTEATVIVEVEDVDENAHAPVFADPVVMSGSVREDAPRGADVLRVDATDADPPGRDSRLAYYIVGGSGMAHFSIDDTGMIRTLSPLDRESVPHYWVTVSSQDHGLVPRHATVQVYIEVEDVNDMSPWPERASYDASVPEHSPAGTHVATVRAVDDDQDMAHNNVTYSIVAGNPDGLFTINEVTGEITLSGRSLDRESSASHALEVRCWDGELGTTARVAVTVTDINDHAPAFTQRFYELRVPAPAPASPRAQGDESPPADHTTSTEWEEEDEGRARWEVSTDPPGVYLGTVVALDPDAGDNGTVRYWARRGEDVRVHHRSGRLYSEVPLSPGVQLDVAVRACDGGARCSVCRVAVRAVLAGGGRAPMALPLAALQVAELDAPGFLLTVLQASDPDGDPLYYDISGGDSRQEFYIGREDGSLVLARRLLWERTPQYTLAVSVTDGVHVVTSTVNITVINDANEEGVSFTRSEHAVEAGEDTRVGEPLVALHARGQGRLLYGIHAAKAPASMSLFRLHELTGVLELAAPLDREAAGEHELCVWARDQAPRASRSLARVRVRVHGGDEHAPAWGRPLVEARVPRTAAVGALVTSLRAADPDVDEPGPADIVYSLAGDADGLFYIDPQLGDVRLSRSLPAGGPREYALTARAAGPPPAARAALLPVHVSVVEPDDAPPTFDMSAVMCSVSENAPAGSALVVLEARSASSVWYTLQGGRGLFRLNPAAGALTTAAPLDYEGQSVYNLTVTALNMGGGAATASVTVHVLDRNEFPPVLTSREYVGRVSEAAVPGALVMDAREHAEEGAPLVLDTTDGDSPANRQRAFEIVDPESSSLFRIDSTTGALMLSSRVDYELAHRHVFEVRVRDAGSPRLAGHSAARVTVLVTDVNDCAPVFAAPLTREATLLLPTARGVTVARMTATDDDLPDTDTLLYDIIEGDAEGVFTVSGAGEVRVQRPDALRDVHRLRVRASDGVLAGTARLVVRVRPAAHAGLAFASQDYYGSVVENTTKPATVAVLNVLGAALNEHVTFSILNPVEGFEVGSTSGAVRSTGVPLDRETRDSYTLLLQARSVGAGGGGEEDGEGRVAHARLHVSVTDVNDNCPVFVERPYVAAVLAGAEPGADVLRVRAIDADADDNGEVRYEMKRGHGELFRVDRRSGHVTLKQTLDAHNQLYTLVIAAFDGGVPACASEASVSVRVWAGGAAPRWERAHYELEAREDVRAGEPLGRALHAVSPLQRQLIYTLVDAEPDAAQLFEIHFETAPDRGNSPCVLVSRAELDHETRAEWSLVVRATDGVTGLSADASVTLRVLDVNDCAPEFSQDMYSARVSEAAARGARVIAVQAADNDTGAGGLVQYSLSAAPGVDNTSASLFTVDAGTGVVRVASTLDSEVRARHHLQLTASDGGHPPRATTAHLFITVEDVNDNGPVLDRGVVSAAVSAEAGRGVVAARVAAWDPDARDAGRLAHALQHAPGETQPFRVNADTGLVTLEDPALWARWTRERGAGARALNVSVSDGAHATWARVKLSPAPANLHAPRFPHLLHEARAQENAPPALLLTTVKAFDEDAGEYGAVTYSIPSAKLRETFSVDPTSGALTTKVPLDREFRAEWEVCVSGTDGGGRAGHTTVRVRVQDVNDNAPVFPLQEYRASVRADRAPRAPFLTVAAHDADAGEHAHLMYSLYEGDDEHAHPAPLFHVDERSGDISFARNASQYASRVVQVWVRARDGGGLAGEAPVTVYVLGADDTAPRLSPPPPDLFLREDAPPGTLIAELMSAATTPGPPVTYRLAPALWPRDLFSVDAQGRLVLAGQLDRETEAEHVIGVIAETEGSPSAGVMAMTRLHVLDTNEHAPAFHSQPYVVHVAENTPTGTPVVQLLAEDPDAGSNGEVRYSLGEGADGALWAVDAASGWVTLVGALDRETRAEHRVPVLASDAGVPRRSARSTLVVRVQDYNDCAHTFTQDLYEAAVSEDAASGTVVARVGVLDADTARAPMTYLVSGGDPRARFQLRGSGEVVVARALDRELQASYALTLVATDGKFTAYANLNITVTDVNDNPPYCVRPRYRVHLSEDAPAGAHVVALLTADADEAGAAPVHALRGDNHHHFHIDEDTGVVTVSAPLDRETVPAYALTMEARDRERREWACQSELIVTIDDVNDNAPRFSDEMYSVTLAEDVDPGTPVSALHASDPDLGENRLVRYYLAEDEPDPVFALDTDTGVVTLRRALDRESRAEHRVLVGARDAGRPPRASTAELRLTVADVNDNPPEFEFREYRAVVPELRAPGTEVLRVRATSRDAGVNADVSYSVVGGEDREDFAVDRVSGVVRVSRPLDYERRREYRLTVQALDGGTPPLTDLALINITLLDENDNAPVFTQPRYSVRVREDAPPPHPVTQVLADDADSGSNGRVTYSIVRGDPDARFVMDADSGRVSLAAALDREAVPAYTLELVARDGGVPALQARAMLHVEVEDANDNAPVFSSSNYTSVVREDRPLGHAVLTLQVSDADAPPNGPPFTFDLQAGNEAGAFRLEQDGTLRTATRFNYRVRSRYALTVRVFDNGSPPLFSDARVQVQVVERSQYPPVVTPLEVLVCSYRDEYPGGALGRVFASDRDPYDTLVYSLSSADNNADLFTIDAGDGTLRAAPRLDVGEYRLNVTVDDGKFQGHGSVRVSVVLVSEETLAQAVVVRFREVSERDFVLSHRKGFVRAVSEATDAAPADVVIISVQPSQLVIDDVGDGDPTREPRSKRQVAQDLDVAFAVSAGGGWLAADAVRRRLHAHVERLEERARLVVEELVRAACVQPCARGACVERVVLGNGVRVVASDVVSLVAPPHVVRARCLCPPGYSGARCDVPQHGEPAPAAAVLQLTGDGYLRYRLERGAVAGARLMEDELLVSMRFRTRASRGTLLSAAGRLDYFVLEVIEGRVQARLELGTGEAVLAAGGVCDDGAWHEARVERRGADLRLTVDRRSARAQAPPPAAVLDVRADRLLVGAQLTRHAHALAPEQVTYGFTGCITDLKLDGVALPLEEGGTASDGRAQLVRSVRARASAACMALAPSTSCSSQPCLHGGTCRELTPAALLEGDAEGYACSCHARFQGRRCELDTSPCASQPCLHGGHCSELDEGRYRCSCAAGLSGARCERGRWCPSEESTCLHGGACEEGEGGPSCRCRGYFGPRCEYDADECSGEPCLNGATCINEPGSFRCLCPPDKTGMNCGNPLYSDAVLSGGGVGGRALQDAWLWALEARWPLAAAFAALLLLLLLALLPLALRRRSARPAKDEPLNSHAHEKLLARPRASKLSNLEADRRDRPSSCAGVAGSGAGEGAPAPLNNMDTLRSYGSAGDELEGIPPDYLRNLNLEPAERKPWSEQMHLHTFVDNKIYNDLKGCKMRARPTSPLAVGRAVPAGGDVHLVGGYHWDCSDWCGAAGALPGISEVAGSERPDSSSPPSSEARPSPRRPRTLRRPHPPPPLDTDSAPDTDPPAPRPAPHPDDYLPAHGGLRARTLREHDAASLITMLEERDSLLVAGEGGSCSDLSAHLCEIEDSDEDRESESDEDAPTPPVPALPALSVPSLARHTDV